MRVPAAVFLVLGLSACKAAPPAAPAPPPPDPAAAASLVTLGAFRDRLCACKDWECPLTVAKERLDFFAAEHGRYAFTDEQRASAATINAAYDECARHAATSPAQAAIAELRELDARMCACQDKACADRVAEGMAETAERYKDMRASEDDLKTATGILDHLGGCLNKLAP